MTQTTDRPTADQVHEVDLAITGMTCASCSARIEKKLGKLDGVDAVVNLATEKATVRFAEPVTVEQLLSTVRATGYGAEVVEVAPPRSPTTTRATSTTRSPPRTPSSGGPWSRPCSPFRSSCSRWCPASTCPTARGSSSCWPRPWCSGRGGPSTAPPR